MNHINTPRWGQLLLVAVALVGLSFSSPPVAQDADIRMCAVEDEATTCPTDNPVFASDAKRILISVSSTTFQAGDEVRFAWYRIDDDELFSTYLGTVYQQTSSQESSASLPTDVEVLPGRYEVIVHLPRSDRPVIKNFKVLD